MSEELETKVENAEVVENTEVVATSENKKDANGSRKPRRENRRPEKVSDYIPCSFYGSLAYMMKTARVSSKYLIYGRMVNRNYFCHGEQRTAYELQVYRADLLEEPELLH